MQVSDSLSPLWRLEWLARGAIFGATEIIQEVESKQMSAVSRQRFPHQFHIIITPGIVYK